MLKILGAIAKSLVVEATYDALLVAISRFSRNVSLWRRMECVVVHLVTRWQWLARITLRPLCLSGSISLYLLNMR